MRHKIQDHVVIVNGSYKWKTNNGSVVNYSTQQVWRDLKSNRSKVEWHHVIWFKGLKPKHAFILWLATLHRFNTQDRMQSWMPHMQMICPLCEKTNDSVNHLFFQCDYSGFNRLVLAACVYFIWQERNARLFRHQKKAATKVGEDVQNYIRWKLLSLKVKNSSAVKKVAELWNLKWVDNRFKFV
ncbi:uncharacterized protein [Rutidosis leptorrhynchoides]|uniref:uncharacterized protein n=1 Tax=Rutidosis leptorrhynchoides TaxID=125765 RepID=UPI003A996205